MRTDSAGARAFLTDGLGSTLALTDSAGLVQSQYTYEPFGKTTTTGVASTNAFKYTGREDDGTGLYYYRARYYHPALQRFISEDPIGFGGGDVNLYGYVGNGPVNFTDPLGLVNCDPWSGCGDWNGPSSGWGGGGGSSGGRGGGGISGGGSGGFGGRGPSGGAKPAQNFKPPTNPPQLPPGTLPPGTRCFRGKPTQQYPDGYWKLEKWAGLGWQRLDPRTMKPGSRCACPVSSGIWRSL